MRPASRGDHIQYFDFKKFIAVFQFYEFPVDTTSMCQRKETVFSGGPKEGPVLWEALS